jgi:hypothetical protein
MYFILSLSSVIGSRGEFVARGCSLSLFKASQAMLVQLTKKLRTLTFEDGKVSSTSPFANYRDTSLQMCFHPEPKANKVYHLWCEVGPSEASVGLWEVCSRIHNF